MKDTSETPSAEQTLPLSEEPQEALLWAIAGEIEANTQDGVTSDHGWVYDDETGLAA